MRLGTSSCCCMIALSSFFQDPPLARGFRHLTACPVMAWEVILLLTPLLPLYAAFFLMGLLLQSRRVINGCGDTMIWHTAVIIALNTQGTRITGLKGDGGEFFADREL